MAARRRILVAALTVAAALFAGGALGADPDIKQILAPSGALRVALYTGTPTSILPDPKSGGPKGVGYDLGKELAARLGVPYEPLVFSQERRGARRGQGRHGRHRPHQCDARARERNGFRPAGV